MVITRSQATLIEANKDSMIWDYPLPSDAAGFSFQNLNGRLPATGWYQNTVCREIFFIIDGTATLNIDGETYQLGSGDVVVLEPNQKHYGEYTKTTLITFTSPNWYEEQSKLLEQ